MSKLRRTIIRRLLICLTAGLAGDELLRALGSLNRPIRDALRAQYQSHINVEMARRRSRLKSDIRTLFPLFLDRFEDQRDALVDVFDRIGDAVDKVKIEL